MLRLGPRLAGMLAAIAVVLMSIAELVILSGLISSQNHGILTPHENMLREAIVACTLTTLTFGIVFWLAVFEPAQRAAERVEKSLRQSEEELNCLFTNDTDSIVKYDVDGRVTRGNARAIQLLGHEPGFFMGKHFAYFVRPEAMPDVEEHFNQARQGMPSRFQTVVMHANGANVDVDVKLIPVIVKGTAVGVFSVVRDITKTKANHEALIKSQERIRRLYFVAASAGKTSTEQIQDTLRLGTELLDVTEGFASQISGGTLAIEYAQTGTKFTAGTKIPLEKTLSRLVFGTKNVIAIEDLDAGSWQTDPVKETFRWGCYIGTGIEVEGIPYGAVAFHGLEPRTQPWSDDDKDFVQLISALVGSAIERAKRQQELGHRAFYDQLTNLYNRLTFHDRLAQALAAAKRRGNIVALHYIDIDNFKGANDTLGHAGGDAVLCEVANRLRATVREIDTIARIGGDEFVVLQPEVQNARDAEVLGKRLIAAFEVPFVYEHHETQIHISVGIALSQGEDSDATELLKRADTALYDAKRGGKNQVRFEANVHG